MSSSEPPSRIPPRGQSHETKSARDELASKGKVEKIREVDSDETRKRKFLKYYDEDQLTNADTETAGRPTPFDLLSGKSPQPPTVDEEATPSDFGDMEDAIVPSPSYTPPPDLSSPVDMEETDSEATASALPQSDGFWEDVDFPPDQPAPPRSFQETPQSAQLETGSPSPSKGMRRPAAAAKAQPEKKQEASPFGPPGKPIKGGSAAKPEKKGTPPLPSKETGKKKLPSPFEEATAAPSKPAAKEPSAPFAKTGPQAKIPEKGEERSVSGPPGKPGKRGTAGQIQGDTVPQGFGSSLFKSENREGESGGKRGREQKTIAIEGPSLSDLPPQIQPMAATAATQAAPYIHPSTVSLFFQMVGTMYVMAGPRGVTRTEIVLNHPSYANSKFYGAIIRVEKYATAPDSFNITLSGSDEAVASFKTNIPSLMAAFQNGNFAFKVSRLDVEYTLEKPVYHRKEKGGDKGESGGGDLGERRR